MRSNTSAALLSSNRAFWITRGNLLYDRVSQITIDGSATETTGPDGRDESGFILSEITPLRNPAVAGAYSVVYWRKPGATIPALAPMTQYSTAISSWEMWYKVGSDLAANSLVMNPGSAFDIGIYSVDVTDALEDLYNDIKNNAGKSYLPLF